MSDGRGYQPVCGSLRQRGRPPDEGARDSMHDHAVAQQILVEAPLLGLAGQDLGGGANQLGIPQRSDAVEVCGLDEDLDVAQLNDRVGLVVEVSKTLDDLRRRERLRMLWA